MKLTNFAILALIFSGCAAEENLFDEAFMVGKAETGETCRHINVWAGEEGKVGQNNLISMDQDLCPVTEAKEKSDDDDDMEMEDLRTHCVPRFHEGVVHTKYAGYDGMSLEFGDEGNTCELITAPQYWFEGGEKSYSLKITIQRNQSWWGKLWGKGKVKLEVLVFNPTGGPVNQADLSEVDTEATLPIHEGQIVVVMPYPENLTTGLSDDEEDAPYTISFTRAPFSMPKSDDDTEVQAQPDYRLASVNVQTFEEGAAEFEVTICNDGDISDEDFVVRVYTDLPGAIGQEPTCPVGSEGDAQVEHTVTDRFYPSGNFCKTVKLKAEGLEPGIHTAVVMVDDACDVEEKGEKGETNNLKALAFRVGEPDASIPDSANLVLANFTAEPINGKVNYSIVVCNHGQDISTPCTLKLWNDRESEPQVNSTSPAADHTFEIPALPYQGCTQEPLTAVREKATPGTYKAWALVDADGKNFEGKNERDNYLAAIYTVAEPEAESDPEAETEPEPEAETDPEPEAETEPAEKKFPDVYISEVEVIQDQQKVTIMIQVCNKGKVAAGEFHVGLYYDVKEPKCGLDPDKIWKFDGLMKDSCKPKLAIINRDKAGTLIVSAMADVQCKLDEEREDNNSNKREYTLVFETSEDDEATETAEETADPANSDSPAAEKKQSSTAAAAPLDDSRGTAEFGCQVVSTSPTAGLGLHVLLLLGMLLGLRRRRTS